jgi:hypothetical protein
MHKNLTVIRFLALNAFRREFVPTASANRSRLWFRYALVGLFLVIVFVRWRAIATSIGDGLDRDPYLFLFSVFVATFVLMIQSYLRNTIEHDEWEGLRAAGVSIPTISLAKFVEGIGGSVSLLGLVAAAMLATLPEVSKGVVETLLVLVSMAGLMVVSTSMAFFLAVLTTMSSRASALKAIGQVLFISILLGVAIPMALASKNIKTSNLLDHLGSLKYVGPHVVFGQALSLVQKGHFWIGFLVLGSALVMSALITFLCLRSASWVLDQRAGKGAGASGYPLVQGSYIQRFAALFPAPVRPYIWKDLLLLLRDSKAQMMTLIAVGAVFAVVVALVKALPTSSSRLTIVTGLLVPAVISYYMSGLLGAPLVAHDKQHLASLRMLRQNLNLYVASKILTLTLIILVVQAVGSLLTIFLLGKEYAGHPILALASTLLFAGLSVSVSLLQFDVTVSKQESASSILIPVGLLWGLFVAMVLPFLLLQSRWDSVARVVVGLSIAVIWLWAAIGILFLAMHRFRAHLGS